MLQVATASLQMIKSPREGFTTRSRVVPTSERFTPFTTLQLRPLCKPCSRLLAEDISRCLPHAALLLVSPWLVPSCSGNLPSASCGEVYQGNMSLSGLRTWIRSSSGAGGGRSSEESSPMSMPSSPSFSDFSCSGEPFGDWLNVAIITFQTHACRCYLST